MDVKIADCKMNDLSNTISPEELKTYYCKLYDEVNEEFHRIDIVGLINEYNRLCNIVLPTKSERKQIADIGSILKQWARKNEIDMLNSMYTKLKSEGITVKSPDRFLIGPQRY